MDRNGYQVVLDDVSRFGCRRVHWIAAGKAGRLEEMKEELAALREAEGGLAERCVVLGWEDQAARGMYHVFGAWRCEMAEMFVVRQEGTGEAKFALAAAQAISQLRRRGKREGYVLVREGWTEVKAVEDPEGRVVEVRGCGWLRRGDVAAVVGE